MLGCVSADGTLFPPLIIFKAQNLWNSWKGTKDVPGTTYASSDNGWMMTSIFNEWFANFCKTITERPLLIIFDGHVTHLDPATIGLAVRENIALLKLPPHTTDLLQPMDRSCFGPMKYKWNERLIKWQRLNQRVLSKSEFCDLLSDVWRDGLSAEVIQNSFKVTGLYPVNKDAYPKDRLDPVKLDRYNQSSFDSVLNPLNIFENPPPIGNITSVSPSIIEMTALTTETRPDAIISTETHPDSTISTETHPDTQNVPATQMDSAPSCQNIEPSNDHTRSGPSCSFETLLLSQIKHTQPTSKKRRKIDGKGKLLTTEEYLKSIENLDCKRKRSKKGKTNKIKQSKKTTVSETDIETDSEDKMRDKGEHKKNKQKEKIRIPDTDTDTDIGEEEIPYQDESDLEISLSELIDEQDSECDEPENYNSRSKECETAICDRETDEAEAAEAVMSKKSNSSKVEPTSFIDDLEYGVGDFILVVHTTKKNKHYYIARIERFDDEENLSVIYLKRAKKIFFVYPDARIIYSIRKDEIVMKLTPPKQKNKRGALVFNIDLEKYKIL